MHELRNVLGQAKHDWAHDYLHNATSTHLWMAARWHNGRTVSCIPPILGPHGLLHEPADMADAFRRCFFSASPVSVPPDQPDDPPHYLPDPTSPSPWQRSQMP